jgi:hypothetical protein
MQCEWTLAQFLAYLGTWSATQRYIAEHDLNPVTELQAEFAEAWGDAQTARTVYWPLGLRAGTRLNSA